METNKMLLPALRNEEHFQFMTEVKRLVEPIGPQALNIVQEFLTFKNLLGEEDKAIEVIKKSMFTDLITEADVKRNSAYRGFVLFVKGCSHSAQEDKRKAAHNVQIIIAHYGDVRLKPYNEETAAIYNFLQDMESRCANDISLLNAQECIHDLAAANDAFDTLMNQRFDDNARQEIINLRETRKAIDKVYTQMLNRINASILLNGEAGYTEFVKKLNERVSYYKNTLVQRKGRHEAAKVKDEEKS